MRYAFRKLSEDGVYQLSGFPIKASSVVDWLHQTLDVSYCIWGVTEFQPKRAVSIPNPKGQRMNQQPLYNP